MFGRRFDLFTVFGFQIRVDVSWFLVAVFFTWSFATVTFPGQVPDLAPAAYWLMGISATLGLFGSVVLHELAHALAARRYDLPMRGITLFMFGGVAEMVDEPPHPRAEFVVAIAGPIASVGIGVACGIVWLLIEGSGAALGTAAVAAVAAVIGYLSLINFLLVLFNMIPAFPLDGGRVLRAVLWDFQGSLARATRITSAIGAGFGMLLIVVGGYLLLFVPGAVIAGAWNILIGLFLRSAAAMSYQQMLLRRALEGEPVSRFMHPDPIVVPRAISVEQLVEEYVLRHHHKMFPVVDDQRLVGCITTSRIKQLPRAEWDRQSVGAVAERCGPENTISPDTDAMTALAQMSQTGTSRLLVADGDRLLGILSLKDLLRFFSLKVELKEEG